MDSKERKKRGHAKTKLGLKILRQDAKAPKFGRRLSITVTEPRIARPFFRSSVNGGRRYPALASWCAASLSVAITEKQSGEVGSCWGLIFLVLSFWLG
jgi:hypothetical protein